MKIKLGLYLAPALVILSLFLLACTSETPASAPNSGSANNRAAAAANSMAGMEVAVSPEAVAEFAAEQRQINEDWDQFHADFDRWRGGLTSCDRSAALAAFRGFAADANGITRQARNLPSSGLAKALADTTIDAVVLEDQALRQLRDGWQPGHIALLENVENGRNEAASELRSVEFDLEALVNTDVQAAEEFAEAFDPIDELWEEFNDSYDALREEQDDMTPQQVVERMELLIADFQGVVDALDGLPSDPATRDLAKRLAETADDEAAGLNDVLEDLQAFVETMGGESESAPTPTPTPMPSESAGDEGASSEVKAQPTPTPTPTPTPKPLFGPSGNGGRTTDTSVFFIDLDDQVEQSKETLEEVAANLENLAEEISEEDMVFLAEFSAALAELKQERDALHQEYEEWIFTEGGCDRGAVAASLAQFSQRYNQLGAQVNGLSQASSLRPSSDLLVEAFEREEDALDSLIQIWEPYKTDIYGGIDRERANADKLRRLAGRRTQEVVERFGAGP
jgi:methyl-accepting chemotaxis protein